MDLALQEYTARTARIYIIMITIIIIMIIIVIVIIRVIINTMIVMTMIITIIMNYNIGEYTFVLLRLERIKTYLKNVTYSQQYYKVRDCGEQLKTVIIAIYVMYHNS